jgi:hypothetical protein
MKAIAKRLRRLEDEFGPADGNPRGERWRLVVRLAGKMFDSAGPTCRRTLCPNGTVLESVEFTTSSNDRELTQAELDTWVASFPVDTL